MKLEKIDKSEYGKYTEFILTFRACDSPKKQDDSSIYENENE